MPSNDELMQHLLEKGLLTAEEAEGARRLLAWAEKEGRKLSLPDALIRAGVLAAKAHHVVGALGEDATDGDVQASGLRLLEKIGRGSQAVVYKCLDAATDRTVAVKILLSSAAGDAESQQRFIQEARSAAQLAHPNIVTIHQIGFLKNTWYIVMEYVDGGSLSEMLAVRRRFDPAEAIQIMRQAAEGLRYAHSRGFIHRDIKPKNLLVTGEGIVKIADMGLARNVASGEEDKEGKVYGTPYYISPEQVTGDPPPDLRTDIYSLGATFFQMVAGRPPFIAPTPQEIMRKHVIEPLPDPRQFVPDLPPSLCAFLAKALAKEPEDRFQSAADFIAALDAVDLSAIETSGSAEALAEAVDHRRARRAATLAGGGKGLTEPLDDGSAARRRKRLWLISGAAGVLVVVVGAVVLAISLNAAKTEPTATPPPLPIVSPPVAPVAAAPVRPDARKTGANPGHTSKPGEEQPDYVRADEEAAAGMLKDAKDTEAADVMASQKFEAYENVIKWYPKSKAAQEARGALERLRNAPPEPLKTPVVEHPAATPSPQNPDVITLKAVNADVHASPGGRIRYERAADRDNIGLWYNEEDWVSWSATVEKPGTFSVEVSVAAIPACNGNEYTVKVGDQEIAAKVRITGGWGNFRTETLGTVKIAQAGSITVSVKPRGKPRDALMNLKAVVLKRNKE
jgi:hypothetical protein